jgi:hypothetical protein
MTAIKLPGQLEVPLVGGKSNDPKPMSIELLASRLALSEESPSGLIWTKTIGRAVAGMPAGNICKAGYYLVTIEYKQYMAHRIVFAMHHNVDPVGYHIDHIDGVITNNCPLNLRLTGRPGNNSNATRRKDNASGTKGMYVCKRKGRKDLWICTVKCNGILHKKSFSLFKKAEAIEWLRATRIKLHGEFHNHG